MRHPQAAEAALPATAEPVRGRRSRLGFGALGVLCALVLTACGGDGSLNGKGDKGGSGGNGGGSKGSGSVDVKDYMPPGYSPGPETKKPGTGKSPGPYETTEFKDFPYAPLPLARLNTADCLKYTSALATYGNHPSGGMERGNPSIKVEGDECLGWRTKEADSIRDLKAGHVEYNFGYNCSPMYANLDQMGDRLERDLKEARESGPNVTASPFYKLPEFEKGYVFALQRQGNAGSTQVRAQFVTDRGLCTASVTIRLWAANDNGKGLKYVTVDEARAFDEFQRILNAALAG